MKQSHDENSVMSALEYNDPVSSTEAERLKSTDMSYKNQDGSEEANKSTETRGQKSNESRSR